MTDQELDARLTAMEKTLQVLGREVRDVTTQMRQFNENAQIGKTLMEGLLKDATTMAHLRGIVAPGATPVPVPPPTEAEVAKWVAELPPVPDNWSAGCGGSFPTTMRVGVIGPDAPVMTSTGALSPDEVKEILKQHGEG
jgi:hypothetical protein